MRILDTYLIDCNAIKYCDNQNKLLITLVKVAKANGFGTMAGTELLFHNGFDRHCLSLPIKGVWKSPY